MINPQHVRTFCKIIETGSFSQAARELHLSQPAVTQHIRALEEFFQGALLERNRGTLNVTPAGATLLQYGLQVLEMTEHCTLAVRDLTVPRQGSLRVASSVVTATTVLPGILAAYMEKFPHSRVDLTCCTTQRMIELMLSGAVDVALAGAPPLEATLAAVPLFEDCLVLVTSLRHRWAQRRKIEPAELQGEPSISYRAGSIYRPMVQSIYEQLSVAPRVHVEVDNLPTMKVMVAAGLGVAFLPSRCVEAEVAQGLLATVDVAGAPQVCERCCAVYRPDRYRSEIVQGFFSLLSKRFGCQFPRARRSVKTAP